MAETKEITIIKVVPLRVAKVDGVRQAHEYNLVGSEVKVLEPQYGQRTVTVWNLKTREAGVIKV